jgi:hypothetical protein
MATPTRDWLITAVGPPPWATSIFPEDIAQFLGVMGYQINSSANCNQA